MINTLFNSNKILSRSRSPWVDYARGICIILVVYRHVFEGLGNVGIGSNSYPVLKYLNIFFFSFRMPLFFIVSGMFIGASLTRKGLSNYLNDRFQTIFYPLIIWGSIQITLQLVFAGFANARREAFDYVNLVVDPRKIEQFWYLNALFFVSVFYALMSWYGRFRVVHHLVLGAVFYAVAAIFHARGLELGFITDVLFFYVFFAIGDLVHKFILNPEREAVMMSFKSLLILLPIFILVQHYFTYLNLEHKDDYYVQFRQPLLFILAALTGGAFVINVSFLLQRFQAVRWLRVIGYHSLYIYVMHLMITAGVRGVLVKGLHILNIPVLMVLCTVAGVLLPVIIYNLLERMGLRWLFTLKKRYSSRSMRRPSVHLETAFQQPGDALTGKGTSIEK